jgi:excisionase family DNA binding protein
MTVEDLANLVKTNKQTIYNRLYNETLGIPHWRMGKRYLFPTEGVEIYINQSMSPAANE